MLREWTARLGVVACAALVGAGCASAEPELSAAPAAPAPESPLTVAAAAAFVDSAESALYDLGVLAAHAAWLQSTYITHSSEVVAAETYEDVIAAGVEFGQRAAQYLQALEGRLPYDVERKLEALRAGLTMPAPDDPALTAELTRIATRMESMYGRGEWCDDDGECLQLPDMYPILANSRDPERLEEIWAGWRTIAYPMKADYVRFVELVNAGARDLGFRDLGEMWRSNYDMPAGEFAEELDRLWTQVQPLYNSLHCYVRAELAEEYGTDVVPVDQPLPAHLLGNMWAQEWGNIYPLVAPADGDPGYDLTERLKAKGYDALRMVRQGEAFFTSLGFEPLPETFWERSLFTKPQDRDVVCHASAWNVDEVDDLRIKMCIQVTAEDFQTVHHELGHNFYQRAYKTLPYLYRASANDGFHEALGDAVALSVTPEYLRQIGLIDRVPPPSADIGLLLRDALDKIAFLPFGLLVDKWRWQVFAGELTPEEYNRGWWDLRTQYQGIQPPVRRPPEAFDPGAKYHVPANVPYARYFLARILQFQFHRALCEEIGFEGPLHRCSIYGSRAAGDRLKEMMAMGSSRPWPEALEALTGNRDMDATAIIDYFEPLLGWLEEQNRGRSCGW